MSKQIENNFINNNLASISLFAEKIKVLIIGGGNSSLIKTKSFVSKGYNVTVVSKDFLKNFYQLFDKMDVTLIKDNYSKSYIENKHIIVIAVNDIDLIDNIIADCDEKSKLFLTCHNFKEGNFIIPTQKRTENIQFALNTLQGNPIASLFLLEKTIEYLKNYDELVGYASRIREQYKNDKNLKEIMKFICSDDFNEWLKIGKANQIIDLFYPKE